MDGNRNEVAEILRQALDLLQPATRGNTSSTASTAAARVNLINTTAAAGGFSFNTTNSIPTQLRSSGDLIADRSAGRRGTIGAGPVSLRPSNSPSAGLSTLRRLREDERQRIFSPYSSPSPSRNAQTSSPSRSVRILEKRFFGLGSPQDVNSPSNARRSALQDIGLGEKLLKIGSSMSSAQIKEVIRSAFLMYENSEFELLKAAAGGPGKSLFAIKSDERVPNTSSILASKAGIVYVRPFANVCNEAEEADEIDQSSNEMSISDVEDPMSNMASMDLEVDRNATGSVNSVSNRNSTALVEERSSLSLNTELELSRASNSTTSTTLAVNGSEQDEFETFENFRDKSLANNPGIQPIFVQRDGFLEQILGLYVKDSAFDIYKKPNIMFAGEPARDIGGVTREYFDYGQNQILNGTFAGRHCIFEGQEGHKVPTNDQALLKTGVYKAVGRFIAHSFMHTGKCLFGLSQVVVNYLCSQDDMDESIFTVTTDDVPCYDTRLILAKINAWTADCPLTDNHMILVREVAISSGFMAEITLANKQLLQECILMHNVVHLRKPQLDAMKDALKNTPFHNYIKSKPYMFDFAFPPASQRIYTPEMLLSTLRFNGDPDERVKTLFESYINNLDSITITEFLKCVTAWSYMPTDPIIIDVGDHPYIHFATCYQTIDIPRDMSDDQILENLMNAVANGSVGFGGI